MRATAIRGWEKAFRHWTEASFYNNGEPFDDRSAYLDLILHMNFEDKIFKPKRSRDNITIHKGEIFTSIENLGKRWMWSENKVRRYLKMMEKAKFLKTTAYTSGTLVTIINTDKSESERRTSEASNGRTGERTDGRTGGRTGGRRLNTDKTSTKDTKDTRDIRQPGFDWGNLE